MERCATFSFCTFPLPQKSCFGFRCRIMWPSLLAMFRVSVEVHRHQPSSFGSPLPAPGEDIILLPGTFYSYDGCSFTGLDRVVPAKIRSTVGWSCFIPSLSTFLHLRLNQWHR
ncbi:hypothetical protein MRX96_031565 [Rhipicephalus microplus]